MRIFHALVLVASVLAQDEEAAEQAPEAPKEPKKPNKYPLAPVLPYLKVWSFLHGDSSKMPKVLLVPHPDSKNPELDAEAPTWFSSAALAFKSGKKKTASFGVIAAGDDAKRAAGRFAFAEHDEEGVVLACLPADGTGVCQRYTGSVKGGGGDVVRELRRFVQGVVDDGLEKSDSPDDTTIALPTFPEPDRPRKQPTVSVQEIDHENLAHKCFGPAAKALCVLALLPSPRGAPCPESVTELARRHKHDPIQFGWVGTRGQTDFLSTLTITRDMLSAGGGAIVALKGGRRPRAALLEGGVGDVAMAKMWMDDVLGGGMQYIKLKGLPELEPDGLLDKEEL